jgi:hypothetical protein
MTIVPDNAFEVNEPTVISETIDGETVIINLDSGTYYILKHSGATIWAGLKGSARLAHLAALVRSAYQVGDGNVEAEISVLLAQLSEEGLIRTTIGDASSFDRLAVASAENLAPFLAPVLEKFTDMETMLLLDPVHDVDVGGWPYLPEQPGQTNA